MMKELDELGKKLTGSVLTIGFEGNSKLVKELNKNKMIETVYTLTNDIKGKNKKKRKKKHGDKTIDIKKLKKTFKNESFDYIICDFDTITPFFRSFVNNSILLANKNVYLYVEGMDYEHEQIMYRYERYGAKIVKVGTYDYYLFDISVKEAKITFLKSFMYWFKDFCYDFIETLANILIG